MSVTHRIEKILIKIATGIGAVVVLLQLIFSKRKRQEWQQLIERLDATNQKVEKVLAEIAVSRANR